MEHFRRKNRTNEKKKEDPKSGTAAQQARQPGKPKVGPSSDGPDGTATATPRSGTSVSGLNRYAGPDGDLAESPSTYREIDKERLPLSRKNQKIQKTPTVRQTE